MPKIQHDIQVPTTFAAAHNPGTADVTEKLLATRW